MSPLNSVTLRPLMAIATGREEINVGLIDGPVAKSHPELVGNQIQILPGTLNGHCAQSHDTACNHGTFVAGILNGKRDSVAPAICPDCTLLVRPIFAEMAAANGQMPNATPEALAAAIIECIEAGARVLNLSVALAQPSFRGQRELEEALNYAVRQGAIVVAAAGNQGTLGSSAITRHSGVIPVVACDWQGRPMNQSNLGRSIGRLGLSAPGDQVTSLSGVAGQPLILGGTSVAAPFVTGAIALLWSEFPTATVTEVKFAVTQAYGPRRMAIVPPLLNAWAAYQVMLTMHGRRQAR